MPVILLQRLEELKFKRKEDIMFQEIKRQLIRHNRQAKKRKEGDVLSTTINYYFHDGLTTSVLVRADNGRECSYTDSLPEAKMMYISCGYFGGVAHEVGHALGLEHTHTRHDRDDYLIVNWTNVKKEFKEMAQKVPDLKLETPSNPLWNNQITNGSFVVILKQVMMRTIPIIFLFVIYVSGLVSGGTTNEKNSRNRWMQKRSAGSSEIINYYFDYKMEQTKKDLFRKAAKAWEDYTCVEFKEDNKRASNPMFVRGDYDCSFNKSPGEGTGHILSVGCGYFGGAAHEVGHALGLIHTHTRYDRETYLTVNSTNVEDYKRVQYGKSEIESDYYGVPYDYGSIMHYGTADVNPSMIPTDKNHKRTMGSQFISFTDLLEVNKRYNCLGRTINTSS
ncbi:astacin [Ancylostoma ceylanicum]|uniref:Metalloendopeptidase n=1 Tax=Ancylostoma ceylanicum TaxID=53326 RepID=A0A0D6M771_9BILA|nr:astacin [Ancylostoma ceylanicum]